MTVKIDKRSRSAWTDDKLLDHLLNNKSDKTRWKNISVLRSRPSKELFLKCVDLTGSKSPKSRSLGIDILAQLGRFPRPFFKQTIKVYFELLEKERNPEVLMSLLYAIGHNNESVNKAQVDKLCTFSNTQDHSIKAALVCALLGVDHLKAIDVLIKLSSERSTFIRNWSTFGLGTQIERNNSRIREALWKRVDDRHQETKLEAILGLAKRKDERVKEIITRELADGEYGTLLFEAILETGDKQFLPLLRQNLKSAKSDKGINPGWLKDLRDCIAELSIR